RVLAQRYVGWKLACSVWVLIVGVGFVFFSVLGWAIGAALSGSRRMWNFTGMWFALYIVAIVAIENWSDDSDLGVVVFIAIWIGSGGIASLLSRSALPSRCRV